MAGKNIQVPIVLTLDDKGVLVGIQRTKDGVGGLEKTGTRATTRLADGFRGMATQIAAAYVGLQGLQKLGQTLNALGRMENQLRLVTRSSAQLAAVQGKLLGLANDSFSSFYSVGELYARIARASDTLGYSQAELLRVTDITTKAVAISGATASESSAGLIQFAQGLASNRLQGDELRSVLENLPGLARAIAAGLGVSIGEIRTLAAEGKLTAQQVIDAILSQEKQVKDSFAKMTPTIAQGWEVATNGVAALIETMDEAIGVSSLLGKALADAGKELSELAQGAYNASEVANARKTVAMFDAQGGPGTGQQAAMLMRARRILEWQREQDDLRAVADMHAFGDLDKGRQTPAAVAAAEAESKQILALRKNLALAQIALMENTYDQREARARLHYQRTMEAAKDDATAQELAGQILSAQLKGIAADRAENEKTMRERGNAALLKLNEQMARAAGRQMQEGLREFEQAEREKVRIAKEAMDARHALVSRHHGRSIRRAALTENPEDDINAGFESRQAGLFADMESGELSPAEHAEELQLLREEWGAALDASRDKAMTVGDSIANALLGPMREGTKKDLPDFVSVFRKGIKEVSGDAKSLQDVAHNFSEVGFAALRSGENIGEALGNYVKASVARLAAATAEYFGIQALDYAATALSLGAVPPGTILRFYYGGPAALLGGGGGGGSSNIGDFGQGYGAGYHGGGVVGAEASFVRPVSAGVFAGAPRLHGGGIAGGEVPAILQRGEGVFTRGQMEALGRGGGGGGMRVRIVLENQSGVALEAEEENPEDEQQNERRIVLRAVAEDIARGGAVSRSIAGTFGVRRQPQ